MCSKHLTRAQTFSLILRKRRRTLKMLSIRTGRLKCIQQCNLLQKKKKEKNEKRDEMYRVCAMRDDVTLEHFALFEMTEKDLAMILEKVVSRNFRFNSFSNMLSTFLVILPWIL